MTEKQETPWEMIEEEDADSEVAALYDTFKRDFQMPHVPNYIKSLGQSPAMLKFYMDMMGSFYQNLTLPQSLISMIQFAVAKHAECTYCSALQEVTCRTLGVDEATLNAIVNNISEVNPERVRAIIELSLKVAKYPKSVTNKDYQKLRDLGITDDEIIQIIFIAGMGVYSDILADAAKIEVDADVIDSLKAQ